MCLREIFSTLLLALPTEWMMRNMRWFKYQGSSIVSLYRPMLFFLRRLHYCQYPQMAQTMVKSHALVSLDARLAGRDGITSEGREKIYGSKKEVDVADSFLEWLPYVGRLRSCKLCVIDPWPQADITSWHWKLLNLLQIDGSESLEIHTEKSGNRPALSDSRISNEKSPDSGRVNMSGVIFPKHAALLATAISSRERGKLPPSGSQSYECRRPWVWENIRLWQLVLFWR